MPALEPPRRYGTQSVTIPCVPPLKTTRQTTPPVALALRPWLGAPVTVSSTLKLCTIALEAAPGVELPKLPKTVKVAAKVGLDRAPVDLTDEDAYAWLEACIWADQPERLRYFGVAAKVQAKAPPVFVTGDAVDDLATAAALVPAELPLVVITSTLMPYLSEGRRKEFVAALGDLGRPVWWVGHEAYAAGLAHVLPGRDDLRPGDGEPASGVLGTAHWDGTGAPPVVSVLAKTGLHGQRLVWLA